VAAGGVFIGLPAIQRMREDAQTKKDLAQADMTLAAFLAQRPNGPTKLTVECRLDNYYNFAYINAAATHHSLLLEWDSPFAMGHAWVTKDSEAGKEIFEVLKDGRKHRMTLEVVLQGPDGTPTPPGRQEMAVVRLVK